MFNFEKEILSFVRDHPGCDAGTLIEAIGHPNAANEANYMVRDGKLDRWYMYMNPHYYIPGTYTPQHLMKRGDKS